MDTEKSGEVSDASETPQQEETEMEKEFVSKLETPEEFPEPEKPPAADEETGQLIVTENVMLSEQQTEMKIDDGLPKEISEMEAVPAVEPTEPDESSKKISDPVAALDTEPENAQPKQQPAPKNDPEPLPVQTPLAESAPEPKPEKLAESGSEAELEEQTIPKPTLLQQAVDTHSPSQEEKVSQQGKTETELQTAMETGSEEVSKKVAEDVAVKPIREVEEEKPTEAVTTNEEASAEIESVKPAEDKKEVEPEKSVDSDTLKGAGAASAAEGVKSEKNNAELQKEEETVPAPSSLSFALLEQEQTRGALQTSRTLVVLRGLPGSGKSYLARVIADAYKDNCSVVCADDHGVKPENPESSVEGYKALDEAVVACCSAGATSSILMVVDDTNHIQDRLARLWEIAEQHNLVAVFLEPCTEWRRDPAQLTKKTSRDLEEAQLEAMRGQLEEMSLPLYFGWFLLSSIQDKVRCTAMDFLKTLDTLEAFKKHLIDFTGKAEKEVDLEEHFEAKGTLHCTTKFCDYGKAEGAKEYAEKPAVKNFYGSAFELSLSALFVTPRTVGARVSLTEEQLLLWPADAEEEAGSPSMPLGSRAHVTLGCAEGVEPVETGLDLLQILALQQEGHQGELIEEMELGSLTYYGEGRWLLSLREPICSPACFSSFYGRKELDPAKKEPEKKKKQKCTIL
ncbi:2',3'-cyclic-nucleotide 3'-phosphodiesterase isoform X2 [Etheostoma cragini]|uniref:2',3'-cyclic-nucleotide 3'-phosphodiesterase isoform X2 n=1 Tax=Etheostoma cragini TaxID=417921 RepID=UPI00155F10C2|nr:2',3'-cyclic-nucleotide 3'-phosphodiesterase isoform X2 [Etheostoma cragini]